MDEIRKIDIKEAIEDYLDKVEENKRELIFRLKPILAREQEKYDILPFREKYDQEGERMYSEISALKTLVRDLENGYDSLQGIGMMMDECGIEKGAAARMLSS